mmetsp:Transcript_17828/g.40504  ORF Transcript_17828/g.40504 Transcript_17828/m.40504 type:complete len:99 (-) Transcript_17828:1243-1539(-)
MLCPKVANLTLVSLDGKGSTELKNRCSILHGLFLNLERKLIVKKQIYKIKYSYHTDRYPPHISLQFPLPPFPFLHFYFPSVLLFSKKPSFESRPGYRL